MQRTVRRILLITAAFALFVVPAAAIAAAGFTDVADDSVFVADIQWMKDNDITRGCNPPANDRFCPSNNVTREQMSAFMHRLAVNQVVDAATAIEADNADTLDGLDSTDFVPATALVPVATALIDLDPSSLTVNRGAGFTKRTHVRTGVICLELDPSLGLAGADVIVSVSPESSHSSGTEFQAFWHDNSSYCGKREVEIRSYETFFNQLSDDGSFVVTAFYSPEFGTIPMAATPESDS